MRIIGMIIIIGMVIGAVVSIDYSKFLDLQSLLIVLGGAIGYALAKGKPKEFIINFGDGCVYMGWIGLMIGITGVSGSGKSSLVNDTLYPILNNYFYNGVKDILPFKKINGVDNLDKVVDINQSPIGRTPRSNPVTYCGVFSEIRLLFSKTQEAQIRGYKPGRFSFNVTGGRCETCSGGGMRVIEMNFLPDVYVECESCQGQRFNRETLEIYFKGKNISDILNMTINQAVSFFKAIPKIYNKLKTIQYK